ncbi:hypothetical protein JW721_01315 [Candidatus Micrarchaeota archaeon]|nr:hypothetical protein [Candidatus Micrarchaeota archaeon]
MGSRQRHRAKPQENNSISAVPTKTAAFVSAEDRAAASLQNLRPKPSPIKGSEEFNGLRALLDKPEPKTASAKKARFDALLRAYGDSKFVSNLNSRYVLLVKRKAEAGKAKGAEAQERLSREIRGMEEDVALYRRLHNALNECATDADKNALRDVQRTLWRKHGEIYGYEPSELSLLVRLQAGGLDGSRIKQVYSYIEASLARGSPQAILVGSGPNAEKNAKGLAAVLRQYPQLMLTGERVRATSRLVNGEMAWRVELGAPEKFKSPKQESVLPVFGTPEKKGSAPQSTPNPKAVAPVPVTTSKKEGPKEKKTARTRAEPKAVTLAPERKPTGQFGELTLDTDSEQAAPKQEKKKKGEKPKEEKEAASFTLSKDPLELIDIDAEVQPDAGAGDADAGDFLGFDSANDDAGVPKTAKKKRGKKGNARRKR